MNFFLKMLALIALCLFYSECKQNITALIEEKEDKIDQPSGINNWGFLLIKLAYLYNTNFDY